MSGVEEADIYGLVKSRFPAFHEAINNIGCIFPGLSIADVHFRSLRSALRRGNLFQSY
jgi:hypothetical protein